MIVSPFQPCPSGRGAPPPLATIFASSSNIPPPAQHKHCHCYFREDIIEWLACTRGNNTDENLNSQVHTGPGPPWCRSSRWRDYNSGAKAAWSNTASRKSSSEIQEINTSTIKDMQADLNAFHRTGPLLPMTMIKTRGENYDVRTSMLIWMELLQNWAPLLPPPSCMPLAAFRPDQRVKAAKTETFPFIGILVGQCGNAGICHRNARQEAPNSNTAIISVLITGSLKCARNFSLFRRPF